MMKLSIFHDDEKVLVGLPHSEGGAQMIGDITRDFRSAMAEAENLTALKKEPVPMRITCPECGTLHIDEGEFATKPHHTHACQSCGHVWRPAIVPTVGVQFLPGFKNSPAD